MMEENLFSIRLSGPREGNFVKKKKKEEKTVWDVGRVLSSVDFWFLMKSSWQTNVSCSLGGAAHRLSRGDH